MAVIIVKTLEVIHVDHKQRDRPAYRGTREPFISELFIETAPVGEARQTIALRQAVEAAVLLFQVMLATSKSYCHSIERMVERSKLGRNLARRDRCGEVSIAILNRFVDKHSHR